jgi:putative restriction endonuclease
MARHFGAIPGVSVGTTFHSRAELAAANVHRPLQAGISGSEREGADSIVVSGGYEDDEDNGSLIIYTGHGGNDPNSGKQVADQLFERGNKALAANASLGLPVRVVRGPDPKSKFAPINGYRYDGLFRIDEFWREKGRSGFTIWRYRLVQQDDPVMQDSVLPAGNQEPGKRSCAVIRVIRSTEVGNFIKTLYKYACQVCGTVLETPAGRYAEAAHIRPLGAPHNGPDTLDNVLCLCPNHHALFDYGSFAIAQDLSLHGIDGKLRMHPDHPISPTHLKCHREHFFPMSTEH